MWEKALGILVLVVAIVAAVAGDTLNAAVWCAMGGLQLQLSLKKDC